VTDVVTAAVKLLAVEQELVFADEQDYQHAVALGVACYQAGYLAGRCDEEALKAEFCRGFTAGEVNAALLKGTDN
jgi:hypothetical protein